MSSKGVHKRLLRKLGYHPADNDAVGDEQRKEMKNMQRQFGTTYVDVDQVVDGLKHTNRKRRKDTKLQCYQSTTQS